MMTDFFGWKLVYLAWPSPTESVVGLGAEVAAEKEVETVSEVDLQPNHRMLIIIKIKV